MCGYFKNALAIIFIDVSFVTYFLVPMMSLATAYSCLFIRSDAMLFSLHCNISVWYHSHVKCLVQMLMFDWLGGSSAIQFRRVGILVLCLIR